MVLIFKFFLSLIGLSISALFIASTLSWLELAALASLARSAAAISWLGAYIVISLQTGLYLVTSTASQLQNYFHPLAREQRRLLFIQNKSEQLKQSHLLHRRYLNELYESKRLRLLKANNKKHAHELSPAIESGIGLFNQPLLQSVRKTQRSETFSQQRIADLHS